MNAFNFYREMMLSEIFGPDKADFDAAGIDTPSDIPYNPSGTADHWVEIDFPGGRWEKVETVGTGLREGA
jgi:hypothetical protein